MAEIQYLHSSVIFAFELIIYYPKVLTGHLYFITPQILFAFYVKTRSLKGLA